MKKTICQEVMTFDELSDKAKEAARDWYRIGALDYEWYDTVYEDAERIGLKIEGFDLGRASSVDAEFLASAEETAHLIEKEHGEACETFIDAKAYLKERDGIIDMAVRDENGDFVDQSALDETLDKVDAEFLRALEEDYRIMLDKEYEYLMSDEVVEESILANEYTFTASGKREG